MFYSQVILR